MPQRKVGGSKPGERRGNAGKGRPKGSKNRNTKALKDMILGALEAKGGQEWLERQMVRNPVAMLTLIGKVLPSTLEAIVRTQKITPEQADAIVEAAGRGEG